MLEFTHLLHLVSTWQIDKISFALRFGIKEKKPGSLNFGKLRCLKEVHSVLTHHKIDVVKDSSGSAVRPCLREIRDLHPGWK